MSLATVLQRLLRGREGEDRAAERLQRAGLKLLISITGNDLQWLKNAFST